MKPNLKFVQSDLLVKGQSVYRTSDMTLEYQTETLPSDDLHELSLSKKINRDFNLDNSAEFLLIIDTLTLTFSGEDHHLSGLDAYTNKQLWEISPFSEVPEIKGQGLLVVDTSSFKDGRYAFGFRPKYEIAANQDWVRVVLGGGHSELYYEVASNLVLGLKNEMITDMYLLNIKFL